MRFYDEANLSRLFGELVSFTIVVAETVAIGVTWAGVACGAEQVSSSDLLSNPTRRNAELSFQSGSVSTSFNQADRTAKHRPGHRHDCNTGAMFSQEGRR